MVENILDLRRSSLDIMQNILSHSSNTINTTALIQKCGLSYSQFKFYMVKLERLGLIKLEQEHVKGYHVTEKGKRFIEVYNSLSELLEC